MMSKISKGFFWSAVDQFSVQAVSFILSIIIARLVSPAAYGVVVMVQVFMSFGQLFIDGGFKSALIQKNDRNEDDFYTVFIFNMAVAIVLYFVMFAAAPWIAKFYKEPQLINLTRVISLNLIFASLSITQLIKLQATFDFKTQAKARLISTIIGGGIGVYCAYRGMEAWALVIQSVLSTLLTSIFLMFFSRWMPKLVFSIESFRKLFGFGSKILFSNFLTNCYIQITNLFIGKFYLPTQLAYYNRGFSLAQLPSSSIMEVMGRTIYPIFCNLQGDKGALDLAYRKYLRLSCLIIFPILSLVTVLAKPMIIVLLTDKWVETAPLLTFFCIAFATYPFLYNAGNYSLALGFAGLNAKAAVIKRTIAFILLIAALPISVTAVAISLVVSNYVEMFISFRIAKISGELSIGRQLGYVKDIFLITVLSAASTFAFTLFFSNIFVQLLLGGFVGVAVYLICIIIFNLEEKQLLIDMYHNSLDKIRRK